MEDPFYPILMPLPSVIAPFADTSSASGTDGSPNGLAPCQYTGDGALTSIPQGNAPPIINLANVYMFGVGARLNVSGLGAPWVRAWVSQDGGLTFVVKNGANDVVVGEGVNGIAGGIGVGFSILGTKAASFFQDPNTGNLAVAVFDTVALTWASPNVSSISMDTN